MTLFDSQGRPVSPIANPVQQAFAPEMMTSASDQIPMRPRIADYQRWRQMTVDEMLLENRVVFLVGEIDHASATGVIMRFCNTSLPAADELVVPMLPDRQRDS